MCLHIYFKSIIATGVGVSKFSVQVKTEASEKLVE